MVFYLRVHTCFFFNDTATTEIYTLSLHDALPISAGLPKWQAARRGPAGPDHPTPAHPAAQCGVAHRPERSAEPRGWQRSEEHTSELQSLAYLVCRLLLEKKNHQDRFQRRTAFAAL